MTPEQISKRYAFYRKKYPKGRYCGRGDFGCDDTFPVDHFHIDSQGRLMNLCKTEYHLYKNSSQKAIKERSLYDWYENVPRLRADWTPEFV